MLTVYCICSTLHSFQAAISPALGLHVSKSKRTLKQSLPALDWQLSFLIIRHRTGEHAHRGTPGIFSPPPFCLTYAVLLFTTNKTLRYCSVISQEHLRREWKHPTVSATF